MNHNDLLSGENIAKYLPENAFPFEIEVHESVTSTNDLVRIAAENGANEGLVILAEEQTAGKGRMNRSFYSPLHTGIYLSLLLRPKMQAQDAQLITTAAAVAVSRSIEKVTGCETSIKWVNDLYCHGRKVSGILTEASFKSESSQMDYAVLGIGINVRKPVGGFPDELGQIASAILESDDDLTDVRGQLAAGILVQFWESYQNIHEKTFLQEYKDRSFLIGRRILVHGSNSTVEALALSIDDDCHLIVRLDDGSTQTLSSGEVSVRMI